MVTPIRATLKGNWGGGGRAEAEHKSSRNVEQVALLPRRILMFDPPHRGFYIVGRTL